MVKSTPLHFSGSVAVRHLNLIHKKELLSFSFFKKVKVLHKYLYMETLILQCLLYRKPGCSEIIRSQYELI